MSPRRTTLALLAALGFAAAGSGTAMAQAQAPAMSRAQARAVAQACRPDANRLCPGVQPGGGRILACLRNQAPQLSPTCRGALP